MTIETNTGVRPGRSTSNIESNTGARVDPDKAPGCGPGNSASPSCSTKQSRSGGPITAADCAAAIGKFLGAELEIVAAAFGKALDKLQSDERRRITNMLTPARAASPGDDPTIDGPDGTMRHQREEARLFKKFGHNVGAVDAAMRFGREWDELSAHGMTRMSRDRYVDLSMQRAGYV